MHSRRTSRRSRLASSRHRIHLGRRRFQPEVSKLSEGYTHDRVCRVLDVEHRKQEFEHFFTELLSADALDPFPRRLGGQSETKGLGDG